MNVTSYKGIAPPMLMMSQSKSQSVRLVAQMVERRTPNLLPVRARVQDASALDI